MAAENSRCRGMDRMLAGIDSYVGARGDAGAGGRAGDRTAGPESSWRRCAGAARADRRAVRRAGLPRAGTVTAGLVCGAGSSRSGTNAVGVTAGSGRPASAADGRGSAVTRWTVCASRAGPGAGPAATACTVRPGAGTGRTGVGFAAGGGGGHASAGGASGSGTAESAVRCAVTAVAEAATGGTAGDVGTAVR